jgi:putative ABC transport system permease protein
MISLARKDIQYTLGKFLTTAVGVGMLFGIVLIMIGVYRGMIVDANALLEDIQADLWVVQQETQGPFAEPSRLHEDLKDAVQSQQGVAIAEGLTLQNLQIRTARQTFHAQLVGYDPLGRFQLVKPSQLIAGRPLNKSHYELVASIKTGVQLGEQIRLGRDLYTVVGLLNKNSVSSGGDPLIFLSLADAQQLQFSYSNSRIRSDRARGLPDQSPHLVNTVIVKLQPGFSQQSVADHLAKNLHKSVYTQAQQQRILLRFVIEKATKQIGMFTAILILVSTVIIGLIIYTMTLEKIKEIAIMKLIGIPNSVIIKMIVQETVTLALIAFIFGNLFAHLLADKFPKRVTLLPLDAWWLFLVIIIAALLASLFGVRKVMRTDPTQAIGG